MKKKWLGLAVLALVLVVTSVLLLRPKKSAAGWNVLLITLDTTRADHIGAYGRRQALTPNIDRLAQKGVFFKNCYASVPLTLPSHSSLFTGRYSIANQVRNNGTYFLPESEQTLAEILQGRGYDTRAVVASFVLLSKFGLKQGFSLYDDSLDTHEMIRNYKSEIPAERVYEKFSGWLDQSGGQRFFYWLHFYDPHTPYRPPMEFAKRFPQNAQGQYEGEIAYTDVWVGRVIKDLRERGLLERTLVIITGDHGEAFGEHVEQGHGIFCYEEALKVPLIFYAPRLLGKVRKVAARVGLVDVMPTVLDVLGIDIPPVVQGRSFLSLLKGGAEKEARTLYFESLYGREEMNWAPLTGLLYRDFKYISLPEPELYDLRADRGEKLNLFLRKNLLARDLDKRLAKFIVDHSQRGGQARRELSAGDKEQLQALGYISAFSSQAATALDPKQGILVDIRLKEISELIGQKKTMEAESGLLRLLAEHPGLKMPHIYNLKYKLYMIKRDYNAALNSLKQGIEDFPDIENFRQTLALSLFDMKMYDKAESRCREILVKNPRNTRATILLGEIREKQNRTDEAIGFYAQALDIEPQNVSLRIKYAELLITIRKYEQAVAAYNQLLENEEAAGQPELLLKVALLNTSYGSLDKAEQLLARAVAIKPQGNFFYNYALVLAKNGKIEQAMANMEIAFSRHAAELGAEQLKVAEKALAAWKENI
jgi:arylsulfatase A-like enzyme/Tfp pilus assembly protein PilF